uniref:Uncharacterized protein n=1 Tax=Tanacetum cinerariifolium TaxID=118510 RepID=A0A699GS95_TANCI|nr:hypothetical protein [Tanacetum cinerariifolium]
MSYLTDYKEIDGGYVAFRGNPKGGKITSKGSIRTGKLYFENVYFVQKHVIMQVKLERRKNLSKITFCYHYGLMIHQFPKIQKSPPDDGFQPSSDSRKKVGEDPSKGSKCRDQEQDDNVNNTNNVNAASTNGVNAVSKNISNKLPFDLNMPALEDISTFNFSCDHEDDDEEADMINMDTTI